MLGHCSRPVDAELLAGATDVIAMTAGHAAILRSRGIEGPAAAAIARVAKAKKLAGK